MDIDSERLSEEFKFFDDFCERFPSLLEGFISSIMEFQSPQLE